MYNMAAKEEHFDADKEKNKALQADEIAALSAIYEDSFQVVDILNNLFEFHIVNNENSWWSVTLQVHLPSSYPSSEVPIHKVFTECMSDADLFQLSVQFTEIWESNKGACILYLWVEEARTMLDDLQQIALAEEEMQHMSAPPPKPATEDFVTNDAFKILQANHNQENITRDNDDNETNKMFEFLSGDPLMDRKSTFQAHITSVNSLDDVKRATTQLKQNRKIQHATHNIMAYRIQQDENKSNYLFDCDDDGEYQAGGRLKHLLQILNVVNIVVIVSRWYGGIQLGPDRFKHINNCARDVIVEYCNKQTNDESSPKTDKNRLKRKKR